MELFNKHFYYILNKGIFVMIKGMEHFAYVKTLDVFSLQRIGMLLLISLMLRNGQVRHFIFLFLQILIMQHGIYIMIHLLHQYFGFNMGIVRTFL